MSAAWPLRQGIGHLEGAGGQAWYGGSRISPVATQLLTSRATRHGGGWVGVGRGGQAGLVSTSSRVALKAALFLTALSPGNGFLTPLGCPPHGGRFSVLLSEYFLRSPNACFSSPATVLSGASLLHSFSLFLFN